MNDKNSNQHPQRLAAAGVLLVATVIAGCGAEQTPSNDQSLPKSSVPTQKAGSPPGKLGEASEAGMRGQPAPGPLDANAKLSSSGPDRKEGEGSMPLRNSYYECAEKTEGVTHAIQECIEAEYEYQDDKLNSVYRKLMEELPASRRDALLGEQRDWLAERDNKCSWDAETEGQAQRLDANDCLVRMTAVRADELEAMLQ